MKTFSRLLAEVEGTVIEICAENAKLVNQGDILMYIRPENTEQV